MAFITYEELTAEATTRPGWKIDPARAQRALQILTQHKAGTMVLQARKDENGEPIQPSNNLFIVRGSSGGWYYVHPQEHTCTCKDSTKGKNICKHRIAVYLYTQQIERTQAAVRTNAAWKNGSSREKQLLNDLGF